MEFTLRNAQLPCRAKYKLGLFMVQTVGNLIRAFLACSNDVEIFVVLIIEQEPHHVVIPLGVHVQGASEPDAVKLLIPKSKCGNAVY